MTPGTLAKHLFSRYPEYRLDHLTSVTCKHAVIMAELDELARRGEGLLRVEELGQSLEGRSIRGVTIGTGSRRVLAWSQMHGDEPTATLALLDVFNLILRECDTEEWVREMLADVTFTAVPMLNPDGAERRQRWTAAWIDMNRDARTLATPEAALLRNLQQKLKPGFGFNLHDQELSSVGESQSVTAIALLAPALDAKRTAPMVRVRAMRVAALIARTLGQFVDGHIASYNDAHEPRAFGDSMQAWGTSTVLIESGHWPGDREKKFIRKLNYVAILTALRCIGNGSFQDVALDHYSSLKPNGKSLYDIIIRNVLLEYDSRWSHKVDIALTLDPAHNRDHLGTYVTIKAVGDLTTCNALEMIEGHHRRVRTSDLEVERVMPLQSLLSLLQLYHPTD